MPKAELLTPFGQKVVELCKRAQVNPGSLFVDQDDQELERLQELNRNPRVAVQLGDESHKGPYILRVATEIVAHHIAKVDHSRNEKSDRDTQKLQKS